MMDSRAISSVEIGSILHRGGHIRVLSYRIHVVLAYQKF